MQQTNIQSTISVKPLGANCLQYIKHTTSTARNAIGTIVKPFYFTSEIITKLIV